MSIELIPTKIFEKGLSKLPPNRQTRVLNSLKKFIENPQHPSLKRRPFVGLGGYFIINAVKGDRIILKEIEIDKYELVDVGPHDNVYRRMNRR